MKNNTKQLNMVFKAMFLDLLHFSKITLGVFEIIKEICRNIYSDEWLKYVEYLMLNIS